MADFVVGRRVDSFCAQPKNKEHPHITSTNQFEQTLLGAFCCALGRGGNLSPLAIALPPADSGQSNEKQ
jgi:hypothetical protein